MSRDMKKQRIVVALGGNALGKTPEEQLCLVRSTAKQIADLIEKGYQVVVGHGNGPQVGMINSAMEFSSQNGGNTPFMPFAECGSMTQGYIGYHLQQAIRDELEARGIRKDCATVVTQVVVDPKIPVSNIRPSPLVCSIRKKKRIGLQPRKMSRLWKMPEEVIAVLCRLRSRKKSSRSE